jgi:hypothetical protein
LRYLRKKHVIFVPVYGIPHSGGEKLHPSLEDIENNEMLQKMTKLQHAIKNIMRGIHKTDDILYIFGDLKDTPDNSKKFHYGSCRIPNIILALLKLVKMLA